MDSGTLIAVDIGNSRVKCGVFSSQGIREAMPRPTSAFAFSLDRAGWDQFAQDFLSLLEPSAAAGWFIASVNRPATADLVERVRTSRPADEICFLTASDVPLRVEVPHPDQVGIDRLVAAVAANQRRSPNRPMTIVDVGTAITVDAISADGAFVGGAIACGPVISARALHEFTELLPLIDIRWESPPTPIGKNTQGAMAAGVFWGMVGLVRELVTQQERLAGKMPQVIITGGGGRLLARQMGEETHYAEAQYVEDLTLCGIALTVRELLAHE